MILAENDDGFASCEEEDMEDLKTKRTGDPLMDFNLDLKTVKEKEAIRKFISLILVLAYIRISREAMEEFLEM